MKRLRGSSPIKGKTINPKQESIDFENVFDVDKVSTKYIYPEMGKWKTRVSNRTGLKPEPSILYTLRGSVKSGLFSRLKKDSEVFLTGIGSVTVISKNRLGNIVEFTKLSQSVPDNFEVTFPIRVTV